MRDPRLGRVTGILLDTVDSLLRTRWRGEVNSYQLGKQCNRDGSAVAHVLRRLAEVGWVTLRKDGDGVRYTLTEKGAREGPNLLYQYHPAYTGGPPIPD